MRKIFISRKRKERGLRTYKKAVKLMEDYQNSTNEKEKAIIFKDAMLAYELAAFDLGFSSTYYMMKHLDKHGKF